MMKRPAIRSAIQTESQSDKLVKRAQAVALILTPVLVGALSWMAQVSVTTMGVKKDLVVTSLQILREPRAEGDQGLRDWAREQINRNSDVPLTANAADRLSRSAVSMLNENPLLRPAMESRPPCPRVELANVPAPQASSVAALQKLCERNANDLAWMQVFGNLLRGPQTASAPR